MKSRTPAATMRKTARTASESIRHTGPTALLLALALLATACAPMSPAPVREPTTPLDTAEIAALLQPGASTITGQAFARTVGGEVRYGAGSTILLLPRTRYIEECIALKQSNASTHCGLRIAHYGRTATGDGTGRFKFERLRPGKYYLETSITWGVPSPYGIRQTGGIFRAWVDVPHDGDTVETLLH